MKLFYSLLLFFLIVKVNGQVHVNFTPVESHTKNAIVDMSFSNRSTGFFITDFGEIFQSTNGGDNWTLIHKESTFRTHELSIYNETVSIVATSDSVYCYLNIQPLSKCIRLMSAISNVGFTKDTLSHYVKRPIFWHNEIWDRMKVSKILTNKFPETSGVYSLETKGSTISGAQESKLYYSNDYGVNWMVKEFAFRPLNSHPYQSFVQNDTIYAITNYPAMIYKSYDNGVSWETVFLPPAYFKLYKDYVLGFSLYNGNTVYVTNMQGINLYQDTVPQHIINSHFLDDNNGFLMGKKGMLMKISTDININKEKKEENIIVYPNPTTNQIHLEINNIIIHSITLIDMQGIPIKIFNKVDAILSVNNIPSGNYLLQFETNDGIVTKKIQLM